MKKVLVSILCLLMVFTLMPGMAMAEGTADAGSQDSGNPETYEALLFSDESFTDEELKEFTPEEKNNLGREHAFGMGGTKAEDGLQKYMYAYIGTYELTKSGEQTTETCTGIVPFTGSAEEFRVRLLIEIDGNKRPVFGSGAGMKIEQVGEGTNQYKFTLDRSANHYLASGKNCNGFDITLYDRPVGNSFINVAALAEGEKVAAAELTLKTTSEGTEFTSSTKDEIGNTFLNVPVTVCFNGEPLDGSQYEAAFFNGNDGEAVKENDSLILRPQMAGIRELVITYNNMDYSFRFYVDETDVEGGGQVQEERQLVFSDNPGLAMDSDNIGSQFEPWLELSDGRHTKYLYIATFRDDELKAIRPVPENETVKVRYLLRIEGNKPYFVENEPGLTFARGSMPHEYIFTIDKNKSEYLSKGEGGLEYDIKLENDQTVYNTKIIYREIAPVYDVNYDLSTAQMIDPTHFEGYNGPENVMWQSGQGSALIFNDKIKEWYTCFYVVNRNTDYDARYVVKPDTYEIRTYIGGANDFVIEAREKENGGQWVNIKEIGESYRIFSMDCLGPLNGFNPVFWVKYEHEKNVQNNATKTYEYRLRYEGRDEYLNNGQEGNSFTIDLMTDEEEPLVEFDINEQIYDEDADRYNNGNVMHFDFIGTTLRAKLIIEPGIIKSIADKKIYGDKDKIFIENEPENIKFYRIGDYEHGEGPQGAVELDASTSPFSVTWDPNRSEYIISYDYPERDMYGPHYMMRYDGDIDEKINDKFGYDQGKQNSVHNDSAVITGKLTTAGNVFSTDTIDATTDLKINTTEVVFDQNASGSTSELTEITVNTNDADVTLGGDLVDNMKTATQSNDVSLLVRDVQKEQYYLTDAQKNEVSSMEKAVDLRVQSKNGTEDTADTDIEFGTDGYAKVSIPCSETDPAVYYIDEAGNKEKVPCTYEDGKVTFTANHFSVYGIGKDNGESPDPGPTPDTDSPGFVPAAPQDNVTNSGAAGSDNAATNADLSTSVAADGKANAEVNQATADKIVDKATANKSSEVVIDATTESGKADATTVTLPTDTLQKIVEKTDAEITVKTDNGTVTMDQKATETVAKEAAGTQISIIVEKTKDEKTKMEFELKVVSGGKVIGEFEGGNVKVNVKLNTALAALKDAKLVCVYIDDNGIYTKIGGKKNDDGTYTFTTTHFSSYAVMAESEADEIIDKQTTELVKKTKLVARSKNVKLKTGKKAIKVFWYAKDGSKLDFDGYEVYRSTKRYKGYGVKPIFTTKKTSYINTKQLKKGTKYYYRVRGFKLIDGKKVYTPYSLKAIRIAK